MAETANTAEKARLLAEPVFTTFGWTQVGPKNTNWDCVEIEKHNKKRSKSHPSDAVFKYHDPYSGLDVYLTTDLKSYSSASLETSDLAGALKQLAMAVECANISPKFQELYVNSDRNSTVSGLLFVYNHDGSYDKNFGAILSEVAGVPVPAGRRVFVLGPAQIAYLNTIAHDINSERGRKKLPDEKECGFFYPDLKSAVSQSRQTKSATIESLLGPWLVLRYEHHAPPPAKVGYYFYYRGKGESVDEFKYLLDYIFRYQLLGDNDQITLRMPFACTTATAIFAKAKEQYLADFWAVTEDSKRDFEPRLQRIECHPITAIKEMFSDIAIGMK